MAVQSFDAWVPEIWGGEVITKIRALSAAEQYFRSEPMTSDVKHVPRSGGMSFAGAIDKSASYPEDAATNDLVTLTALKFGKVLRVADEELKDVAQVANIIQTKQLDWARSYAVGFDNACLGVTAAANSGTVPFTSLWKEITGYNSASNKVISLTGVAPTYANVSDTFKLVEESNYWSDGEMIVIAHPGFRARLRSISGQTYGGTGGPVSDGRPVFVEAAHQASGTPDTLFGVPIVWSLGAKTNIVASDSPTGDPLLFVGNRNYAIKGDRSGPEYMLAGADSGPAFLTDEALLKVRVRRGFITAQAAAWAVLQDVA